MFLKNKFIFVFVFIFSLILSLFTVNVDVLNAAEKRIFVALGDSIAEGYAINLNSASDAENVFKGSVNDYSFYENTYNYKIKEYLKDKYKYNEFYDFSRSGDTCGDLISFFSEFYDDENKVVKNAEVYNSKFNSLTNNEIFEILKNARTITICIGANNILTDAEEIIARYLGLAADSITIPEIENMLKEDILGSTETGGTRNILGFKTEFFKLLKIIFRINPKAEVLFNNVYNPFKVLKLSEIISGNVMVSSSLPNLTQERLNDISSLTELAIDGGLDSTSKNFDGINDIIKESIERYKDFNNSNFYYVDVKTKFDNKVVNEGEDNYKNYVNTNLYAFDSIDLWNLNNLTTEISSKYLDPHPTSEGHNLIYNSLILKNIGKNFIKELPVKEIIIGSGIGFILIVILISFIALKKSKSKIL